MANAQTCYFPNGLISPSDTPCHSPSSANGASACCAYSDICLDNQLCLSQSGPAWITRGSCTDETWQSPGCSQNCSDVNPSGSAVIFPINSQDQALFCCSQPNTTTNKCTVGTRGSTAPFYIEAGLVIFNRTSGSTSSNATNTGTVTVTATTTALTLPSNASSVHNTLSSLSSSREEAIGAGIGVPLGLALFIMLGLLWRQTRQKQGLRKDVQTWEGRYADLKNTKPVELGEAEHQPPTVYPPVHQLPGWSPDELDDQPDRLTHQLEA